MSILDTLRKDVEGAKLLNDWMGEGGSPVGAQLSQDRACICVPCPMNVEPNWWDRIKNAISDVIRSQLELKHSLALSTTRDDSLHMCKCCGCCLPLKVHVPIEHIRAHTDEETMKRFPDHCWIRKELNA